MMVVIVIVGIDDVSALGVVDYDEVDVVVVLDVVVDGGEIGDLGQHQYGGF